MLELTMIEGFLKGIFFAMVTAVLPVLTAYTVAFIRKVGDNATANAESIKSKTYITEATEAIAAAVAATNQTFVDALKNAGKFDKEAQREAAQKALEACLMSISPAAQKFIEAAYGDIREYLTTRIEAEVRKQKNETTTEMYTRALAQWYGTLESTVEVTEEITEE